MIISTDVEVEIDEFPDKEILEAALRIIKWSFTKGEFEPRLMTIIHQIRNEMLSEYKPSTAARITQSEYEYLPKYGAGQ